MIEEDLILEVEKHPILYDKSLGGYNKAKLRDFAWGQVQEAIGVEEFECKRRWRSLRDSFLKLQRSGAARAGRTRWPHYARMSFLVPHLEPPTQRTSEQGSEESDEEVSENKPEIKEQPCQDETCSSDPAKQPNTPDQMLTSATVKQEVRPRYRPNPRKRKNLDSPDLIEMYRTSDADELFLLSCLPTLRRMHGRQNAIAKMKIQRALYDVEFGEDEYEACSSGLPYITATAEYADTDLAEAKYNGIS